MKKKISFTLMLLWNLILPVTGLADEIIEVDVLHSKSLSQGGRTITYNIVSPPDLPVLEAPIAAEMPLTTPSAPPVANVRKPTTSLIVEGTVHANGVTKFSWMGGSGYSNVDFTLFSGMTILETEDHTYQLTLLISKHRGETPSGVPTREQFSAEQAEFVIEGGAESPAFDALHAYYDGAKTDLIAAKAASIAAQAAREQELRENPPQPRDVTHNFWPIKSGTIPVE